MNNLNILIEPSAASSVLRFDEIMDCPSYSIRGGEQMDVFEFLKVLISEKSPIAYSAMQACEKLSFGIAEQLGFCHEECEFIANASALINCEYFLTSATDSSTSDILNSQVFQLLTSALRLSLSNLLKGVNGPLTDADSCVSKIAVVAKFYCQHHKEFLSTLDKSDDVLTEIDSLTPVLFDPLVVRALHWAVFE